MSVTALKERYGRARVRIPAGTRVRHDDGRFDTLAESVTGPVRGWEVMTRASGQQLGVLVVVVAGKRLRVAADRVQVLSPPLRFPRLRPSDLAGP